MLKKNGFSAILAAALLTLAVTGIAVIALRGTDKEPDRVKTLTLSHDKGGMRAFQRNFEFQAQRALAATGYTFVPVGSQTPELFINRMNASLPTRDAPELFVWWSAYRVKQLVEKDLVSELTHLWDKHNADYPEVIRQAYTLDGKVYGFPYSIEYWPVWYNKPLFERLNIKVPETWSEFIRACEVLKAAGIPPVLSSLQYQWYSFVWFEELIIGEDPDFYQQLCEGEAAYSDPRTRKAMQIWKDMIEKGYFTDPATHMFTNAGHLWHNEKFGMVLCGSWFYSTVLLEQGVEEDTIGVFILPSHNPAAGKNIVMESGPVFTAKNARYRKEAEVIADWWMGPEGNTAFSKAFKSYSANRRTGRSHLPRAKRELLDTIENADYRILNRYWEATPSPIVSTAVDSFSRFIVNPDEMDAVIDEIAAAASEYWSGRKAR